MHYLGALAQELAKLPFIKPHLLFFPNSSAYFFGDKIRYVEYKYKDKKRVHHISSVDNSSYLKKILNQAINGSKLSDLASLLVDDGISVTEAEEFLEDVVQAQLLVSELEPAITGNELMQQILNALNEIQSKYPTQDLRKIIDILGRINCDLKTIDGKIGNDVKKYHEIIENLKILSIPFEQNKLFQTDMLKISPKATLDKGIQKDLFETLKVLNLINGKSKKTNLNKFKEGFYNKYENKEVPLLEALDNETGLGYPVDMTHSGDFNPLVDGIKLPFQNGDREVQWGKWESFLNRKVMHACIENKFIIKLDEKEINKIFSSNNTRWNDLPDSMAIMFSCLGKIDGRHMVYLRSTGGSSAANLLSRFAHTDKKIYKLVSSIAEREQELNPNAIIAEIVHLPENRTGNILLRPVFRTYEIPFLARSGVSNEHQIRLNDLYISVRNDKILLRSKRLNKEVLPRLSTAHNFSFDAQPIYRFLCDLQTQNIRGGLYFSWGELINEYPFLPRVEYKNVILSYATWNLRKDDYGHLLKLFGEVLIKELRRFRNKLKIPQNVSLVDGDNELLVDFENELSTRMLFQTIKGRSSITIQEFLFDQKTTPVKDIEGNGYTNEFIAILTKDSEPKVTNEHFMQANGIDHVIQRTFMLGSEWIFYKLYCGAKTADRILTEIIKKLSDELIGNGFIDQWFFIRYADPDLHLRVRFHLKDENLAGEVLSIGSKCLNHFMKLGLIWKVQTDTYNRELERYGSNTMLLSEELFWHDSDMILSILDMIEGDAGEDIRWLIGIRGVDELLNDFSYSMENKLKLLETLKTGFGEEFNMNRNLKKQLDEKFRIEREKINKVLDRRQDSDSDIKPLFNLLIQKSEKIHPIASQILKIRDADNLMVDLNSLLSSYMHMRLNRLFKSRQRLHELLVYDFLYRNYKSEIARKKYENKNQRLIQV